MKNKVIILGNDHVNTLGVIRCFGENNIKPYIFIISDTKRIGVVKSRFIEKYWVCNNENEAILIISTIFSNEELKPVIIPTSDSAAMYLDINYEVLSSNFILPNIDNKANNIKEYMNKYNQYVLCKNNNLEMSYTSIIDLTSNVGVKYPCILKPIISAEGKKDDIRICKNKDGFIKAKAELIKLGYRNVLYQEFISYSTELDICGFSYNGKVSIPGFILKQRIWPQKKGSTTFGIVCEPGKIKDLIRNIAILFKKINYNGIFDIEAFVLNDSNNNDVFYINEINFRNSALSYSFGKSYIPYYWYTSNINNNFFESPLINKNYKFMDEQADLHNVIDKIITYKEYLIDRKKSKILLASNKNDNSPSKFMTINKIINKFLPKKVCRIFEKSIHYDKPGLIYKCSASGLKIKKYNYDYEVVELNNTNVCKYFENRLEQIEFEQILSDKRTFGLILTKDNKIICRGFLKVKNAKDYYFYIKNDNSVEISALYVYDDFRGSNYQIDLIRELIDRYAKNKLNYYAFIYYYNIPSIKNFEKMGFNRIGKLKILRILGHSINRKKI